MRNKIALLLFLAACSPSGEHRPVGSSDATASLPAGAVSYDQVQPLFANYCAACHPARSAPNWLNPSEAKEFVSNGRLFRRVWTEKSMPPPGSPQAAALSASDREKIAKFANPTKDGAAPSANAAPAPASSADGGTSVTQSCLQCHGVERPATEMQRRIAKIRGQSETYLKSQLMKFKWRDRIDPTNTMNDVAAALSDEDIELVAQFFSKPVASVGVQSNDFLKLSDRDKKLYSYGEKFASVNCVSCHMNSEFGKKPTSPMVPVLAGQAKQYFIDQLIYFRDNERRNPLMHEYAKGLSNRDIEALAVYFSIVDDSQ